MKYATLLLKRRDLVRANACEEWLGIFDTICAMRGPEKAPLVRLKSGKSVRRPSWLRVELSSLTQLWLARDGIGALIWLRQKGLMGPANLVRANLYGANLDGANLVRANLYGANLDGANLVRANLYGANLDGANLDGANLVRANLDGANLVRANLYGANLDGANLDGANLVRANLDGATRLPSDAAIPGWELVSGVLRRAGGAS